jgi:hypothetical protein
VDLKVHRHRCKRCLVQHTIRWRMMHPMRHVWALFVQRAKRRFGDGVQLTWSHDGAALLHRLMEQQGVDEASIAHYVLTWKRGAHTLDLQQVMLVPHSESLKPRCETGNETRANSSSSYLKLGSAAVQLHAVN